MRVLALGLCTTAHALAVGAIPLLRCTAPALRVSMSSDEALWASLKARIAVSEDESAAPPPLGIDDVGADCMGPADVVEYVMRSMKADADAGATSLMSFAVKYDGDKTEVCHSGLEPQASRGPQAGLPLTRLSLALDRTIWASCSRAASVPPRRCSPTTRRARGVPYSLTLTLTLTLIPRR